MHRPAVRSVACLAAIVFGLALLTACDDSAATDDIPVFHDLAEPWQPVPFAVDPGIIAAAQVVCRGEAGMIPPGANLVLADARGGNWMMLVYAAGAIESECFVRRDEAGRLMMDGGGGAGGGADPAIGATDVTVFTSGSMSSDAPGQSMAHRGYVIGRMGVAVASVEVQLRDGTRVRATASPQGWFAAWWPTAVEFQRAIGFDAAGAPAGVSQ